MVVLLLLMAPPMLAAREAGVLREGAAPPWLLAPPADHMRRLELDNLQNTRAARQDGLVSIA